MTEEEWLFCTNPMQMREYIRLNRIGSERKLRLFALACSWRFVHLLSDERSCQAVAVAHRFVEGQVSHQERAKISAAAWEAADDAKSQRNTGAAVAAAVAAARMADSDWPLFAQQFGSSGELGQQYAWQAVQDSVFFIDTNDQCALWRDLFGNLFRPVSLNPSLLQWHDGTIPKFAQAIYDERAFDRLPILADALEEAGCADSDLLSHCRGPGPHVRGCWVVDLLLGKE